MSLEWKTMYRLKQNGLEPVPIWPPRSGHYQWLNDDGRRSAIVIWHETMDRDHYYPSDILAEVDGETVAFLALRDGREVNVNTVWPLVRGREITTEEYTQLREEWL